MRCECCEEEVERLSPIGRGATCDACVVSHTCPPSKAFRALCRDRRDEQERAWAEDDALQRFKFEALQQARATPREYADLLLSVVGRTPFTEHVAKALVEMAEGSR